ncbi:hypothetical protein HanRHA438_Chr03g0123951 [Helianthus annuus]|nr:hypothetical protein HanRHA438_Chr03g0123951 [Helianthus annuus]
MIAQNKMITLSSIYLEAKRARRWVPDRESYLDPMGNIVIDHNTLDLETIIKEMAEEDEYWQRKWWGSGEEKEEKSKKVDNGIIDITQELNAENMGKMADKVSSNASTTESGKKVNGDVDCKNCIKECKVCSTITYLNGKKIDDLTARVKGVEDQILDRDKMLKASTDRLKELTNKIENDKIDQEKVRKENEKLVLENRQITEKFEKLKRTVKDNDDRNGKTYKENVHLSGVLRVKEELINKQLDEIAKLKLKFQEAEIENERIQLKLKSYNSASFVLQHIVPKPIGKNKAGEDVFSDGNGVGYHQVPAPVLDNYSKKQSGLVNLEDENEVKLPDTIDVTFTTSSDEDSVQTEVGKSVVENVLKPESDTTEEDECFLDKYIPKPKSKNNLNEGPNVVMYKMLGSDKLFSDSEFPLENVNVNKLTNVFKLIEVDLSEVNSLNQTKRQMNFEKDKAYYKKPVVPPRFYNNNRNKWSGGYQGGKSYQKKNVQNKRFVEKKVSLGRKLHSLCLKAQVG